MMIVQSHRVHEWAATVAAVLCCLHAAALPASGQRAPSSEQKKVAGFSLTLQREIPFEHPLLFPSDGAWLMQRAVAIHPDGKRVAVLIPGEKPVALRPRPASGLSERSFLLAWVDLSTGQLLTSRELLFSEVEFFGFAMAAGGDFFCVIADQKVMILDEELNTVDSTQAEITDPRGKKGWATSCAFVPGTADTILVAYTCFDGPPWEWRSSLMQWNWKENTALKVHWDVFLPDSVPLREDHVLIYRTLPDWLKRFRLEEIELRTQKASSGTEFGGFAAAKLVLSDNLVFRVDGDLGRSAGTDSPLVFTIPERFHDSYGDSRIYVTTPRRPGQSEAGKRVPLQMDDRVVVWERNSVGHEREFRFPGAALVWPLLVAPSEAWFVVRAAKFSHFADNWALGWDFSQFVVFSLDGSKRRLYASEKFGPDEAITGFALSRDGKTLLVSTSSRLLVYEVKQY
jgi:hypothetical protein